MKLYVKVIAFSEEDGVKATREEIVEISSKVLRLTEAVMGSDAEELVNALSTSALIAALQTVQIGGAQSRMEASQGSGPIGGGRRPTNEGGARQQSSPLEAALGLDVGLQIIESMDAKDRNARAHAQEMRGGGRQGGGGLPHSPGPLGFGPDRGR